MTANDDALAALQAEVAQLSTDVTALITAIENQQPGPSDDVSAGIAAVTNTLQAIDASVTKATPATGTSSTIPAAPVGDPTGGTVTDPGGTAAPDATRAAAVDPKDAELAALRAQAGGTPAPGTTTPF